MPIVFHEVKRSGEPIADDTSISEQTLRLLFARARALGFQTITTAQLVGFLKRNAPIPQRSLLMIVDDRRPGVVESFFMPLLEKYNWSLTLAWIAGGTSPGLWVKMKRLAASGHLDIQAHGYWHRYIVPGTPENVMRQELFAPIPALRQHFGQRPIAFVWPGGNFTPRAVHLAREAGYQVGFTVYSRGPLMFNWIPLGEPEREVGDPLMVLPRFWSTAALLNLEQAVQIGEQARAQAQYDYPKEAAWYRRVCGGELPSPFSQQKQGTPSP